MSYIGRQISNLSDRVKLDSITASATATYNLLLNTVAYVPSSAESLTVSLNGVIQAPQDSYTVSGSQITFASTLSASDSIDFILAERSITLQTPSSGSVNTEQLADSSVTLAKLSATGTKDATTFLRGDNTFASAGVDGISSSADATAITIDSSENVTINSGVLKIGTLTTSSQNQGFNFDSTGATNISIGGGTSVDITTNLNGSGMLLINDTSMSGSVGLFVTGGGVMSIADQTHSTYAVTSSPSATQIGVGLDSNKIFIKNGMSGTVSLNLQTFRTRTGQ